MTIDTFNVNKETNKIESIKTKNGSTTSNIEINDLEFRCKHLVVDSSYAPEDYFNEKNQISISRCILVTDKSLFDLNEQIEEKDRLEQVCAFFTIFIKELVLEG